MNQYCDSRALDSPLAMNFLAYMMIEYLGPGLACINEFSFFNDYPLTLMADLSTVLY